MPELCRFRGISLLMFTDEGSHQLAHFHAHYAEFRALIGVDGTVLEGGLPRPQLNLVREWAAQHRAELEANWARARAGERIQPVAPLA